MSKTTLRPLGNNLLLRQAAAEDRSASGLHLPAQAQKKPHRGTVLAAGRGYVNPQGVFIETRCKIGDVVIFPDGLGVEVDLDGETLLMLSEDAVVGIVEG
jgi:chaperonin GroES